MRLKHFFIRFIVAIIAVFLLVWAVLFSLMVGVITSSCEWFGKSFYDEPTFDLSLPKLDYTTLSTEDIHPYEVQYWSSSAVSRLGVRDQASIKRYPSVRDCLTAKERDKDHVDLRLLDWPHFNRKDAEICLWRVFQSLEGPEAALKWFQFYGFKVSSGYSAYGPKSDFPYGPTKIMDDELEDYKAWAETSEDYYLRFNITGVYIKAEAKPQLIPCKKASAKLRATYSESIRAGWDPKTRQPVFVNFTGNTL